MVLHVLGHFGKLVTRATTFMFWVFPNSKWIYVKYCHESRKKSHFLTLWKFSKCWKFWLFVDFSKFLDFLWSWWIIWNVFMMEKVWFWKSWPKVKVWLFRADEFSSDESEFVWWRIWTFVMFWIKKLGQDVALKMLRSIFKKIGHPLSRKSMIHYLRSKP